MERYTKDYLNYIKETKDIDMSEQYELFMKYVPKGSKILDAGFGSGRDIAFFKQHYDVTGIDLSSEFVSYVKENIHPNVHQMDILNLKFDEKFDAIWACASLVHFDLEDFLMALNKFLIALKPQGILYLSLKIENKYILHGIQKTPLVDFLETVSENFILLESREGVSNYKNQSWVSLILKKIIPD